MQDPVDTLIAHELAYSFLSKVFYEAPDKAFIDMLAADALFDSFPLEAEQPEAVTGLTLLQQFCTAWNGDNFEALQHDYRRLFVGPDRLLAAPWESVYRSPDHLLFDVQTIQVRRAYQRFGMPIPNLHSEPDDHLGLEFRFIAHLCASGLTALEHQPDMLHTVYAEIERFLDDHLLQWAPECLNRVIEHAATDYYRGCAHLALGCLAHTKEVVQLETA